MGKDPNITKQDFSEFSHQMLKDIEGEAIKRGSSYEEIATEKLTGKVKPEHQDLVDLLKKSDDESSRLGYEKNLYEHGTRSDYFPLRSKEQLADVKTSTAEDILTGATYTQRRTKDPEFYKNPSNYENLNVEATHAKWMEGYGSSNPKEVAEVRAYGLPGRIAFSQIKISNYS
jgi:hypothetical protein